MILTEHYTSHNLFEDQIYLKIYIYFILLKRTYNKPEISQETMQKVLPQGTYELYGANYRNTTT